MTDLSQYEEITDVSFDHEGSHLAVCHKLQGFSSNGWHQSLIMKSEDLSLSEDIIKALEQITVKMSLEEFLRKFFGMFWDDAELLTKLMGFETEGEYNERINEESGNSPIDYSDFLERRVSKFEVMKAAYESGDLDQINPDDYLDVIKSQVKFEKGLAKYEAELDVKNDEIVEKDSQLVVEQSLTPSSELAEDISKEAMSSENSKGKTENILDIKELEKSAEVQELIKSAVAAAVAEKDSALEDAVAKLEKAAEELEQFKVEKAARQKEAFQNLVKSFSYVEEENQEAFAEVLMKASAVEGMEMIVTMLEKAQEKIEKAKQEFLGAEEGFESKDEEPVDIDKAASLAQKLEQKYANKKFL